MATKERRIDRANRRAAGMLGRIGEELKRARRLAGLSQRAVARAVGVSHTEVGRIERGRAPWAPIATLCRIGAVVGLDVSLRAFPGPQPIRDARHAMLFEAFAALLGPGLRLVGEVALPIAGDLRSWDGMVLGLPVRVGVEIEVEVHDAQALERRIALKQRDSDIDHIVLVLADTRRNRTALRAAAASFRAVFPLAGDAVV